MIFSFSFLQGFSPDWKPVVPWDLSQGMSQIGEGWKAGWELAASKKRLAKYQFSSI